MGYNELNFYNHFQLKNLLIKLILVRIFFISKFSIKNNIILKNSFYTFILQFSNYFLPILLIPYLTRVIGVENFGKIAFTQSFVLILGIFTDFGFQLSASREIASNRDNPERMSEITSYTLYIKIILLFLTIILSIPFLYIVPIFIQNNSYFFISWLLLFAKAFNLDWFFLGTENLKFYTFYQILGKVLLIIFSFVFIRNASDAIYYLVIFSFSTISVNVFNLIQLKNYIIVRQINLNNIIAHFKRSYSLFFFNFSIALYTNANSFIIGILLTPSDVGIFSAGEKIIRSIIGIWQPLTSAIYPRINYYFKFDTKKAKQLLKISLILYFCLGTFLFFSFFLLSDVVVYYFLDASFKYTSVIIKILSPIILIVAMSNVLGILFLLPMRLERQFNKVLIFTGFFNIILSFNFTYLFGIKGATLSFLISEIIVFVGSLILYKKYKGLLNV